MPDLPGSSVPEGAGSGAKCAQGVEAGDKSNNDNKDGDAGDKEKDQKGRTPDMPSGSATEIALLGLMREAASKKEAKQKEKEDSRMTDKLDLAVRKADQNRVKGLLFSSRPRLNICVNV